MPLDASTQSVLVFDVLETVVDERGARADGVRSALAEAGEPEGKTEELAAAWQDRLDELLPEASGDAFRPMDELNRAALADAAGSAGVSLGDSVLDDLAAAALIPKPWPDARPGVGALAERFSAVALSNTTMSALAGIAREGGLRWHVALSSELARSYKPDPAVYRLALDLLRVGEGEALMVASRPWDLRAAAEHGMRTAYVQREGCEDTDEFDIRTDSLAALAAELLAGD